MISRSCIRNLFSLQTNSYSQHLTRHNCNHCGRMAWREHEQVTKRRGQHLSKMATFS